MTKLQCHCEGVKRPKQSHKASKKMRLPRSLRSLAMTDEDCGTVGRGSFCPVACLHEISKLLSISPGPCSFTPYPITCFLFLFDLFFFLFRVVLVWLVLIFLSPPLSPRFLAKKKNQQQRDH